MNANYFAPAFPELHIEGQVIKQKGGLTIRQYYAGLFMHAFIMAGKEHVLLQGRNMKHTEAAILCADALLKELEKPVPEVKAQPGVTW